MCQFNTNNEMLRFVKIVAYFDVTVLRFIITLIKVCTRYDKADLIHLIFLGGPIFYLKAKMNKRR